MKAIVTTSLLICFLAWSNNTCSGQFELNKGGPGEITGSAAIYANKILKRRLQTDKRLAVHTVSKEDGGGADVYGSLPFENGESQLHLILGRFQAFGQGDGEVDNSWEDSRTSADIAREVNSLKGKVDEKRLAHTKISAEKLLLGTASADVKVLDEMNAPPVMEGEGSTQRKANNIDGACTEAFDQAMNNRIDIALRTLSAVLQSNKTAREAVAGSGAIRLQNNLICLLALNHEIPQAIKAIEAELQVHPQSSDPELYPIEGLNQANIYLAHKEGKKALAILAKFENKSLSGRLGVNLWHSRLRAYALNGQRAELRQTLEQMVKLYPNNALALTAAGDYSFRDGDYKNALVYFTAAAGLNKNSSQPLLKMAQCQAKLGDLDSAIASATTAINNFPEDAEAHITLGKFYLDNKEYLGARLQFERALETKAPFAAKKAAFTPLIKVLDVMNDDKELIRQLTLWVKEYPQEPVTHYNRAYVLAEKKELAEAIVEYQKALALSPQFNKARYNLALLYRQTNQNEEARTQLSKLLQSPGSDVEKKQAEKLLSSFH